MKTEESEAQKRRNLILELKRIAYEYTANKFLTIGVVLHCIQYEDKGYTAEQCVSHLWGDCGYTAPLEKIILEETEEADRLCTELYRLFILLKPSTP